MNERRWTFQDIIIRKKRAQVTDSGNNLFLAAAFVVLLK
jgi:hypothetical protein